MDDTKICETELHGQEVTLRLLVTEFRIEMREGLSEDIRTALKKGTGLVTFDLTQLDRIYSLFLGLIMDGVWHAKKLERPIRIILKPELYKHFTALGLQNAAELVCRE